MLDISLLPLQSQEARDEWLGSLPDPIVAIKRAPGNSPCTWIVVVHSSGSDQDGIVMLADLDAKLAQDGRKGVKLARP